MDRLSFLLDIRILYRTMTLVLQREGVVDAPGDACWTSTRSAGRRRGGRGADVSGPTADIIYRPARPDDAEAIVAIARRALPDAVTAISVLQSPGYVLYVRDTIATEGRRDGHCYLVAEHNGLVCGMAHLLLEEKSCHLNYIAVDETARGRGVGAELLKSGVRDRGAEMEVMTLDVFEDNARAVAWYRGLGFVETGRTTWSEFALEGLVPGAIEGVAVYPDPCSSGERYGFSALEMHAGDGVTTLGLPGPKRFRLLDASALEDPASSRPWSSSAPARPSSWLTPRRCPNRSRAGHGDSASTSACPPRWRS